MLQTLFFDKENSEANPGLLRDLSETTELDKDQVRGITAAALCLNSNMELGVDLLGPKDVALIERVSNYAVAGLPEDELQRLLSFATRGLAIGKQPNVHALWYELSESFYLPVFVGDWEKPGQAEHQSTSLREFQSLGLKSDVSALHSRKIQVGQGVLVHQEEGNGLRYYPDLSADLTLTGDLARAIFNGSGHGALYDLKHQYSLFEQQPNGQRQYFVDSFFNVQSGLQTIFVNGAGLRTRLSSETLPGPAKQLTA